MALMKDTEGNPIPKDYNGRDLFDIDLWLDDEHATLAMNIPTWFETLAQENAEYFGSGVVQVSLYEILEEYIDAFREKDGGENILKFCGWMENFISRLKIEYEAYLKDESTNTNHNPWHHHLEKESQDPDAENQ